MTVSPWASLGGGVALDVAGVVGVEDPAGQEAGPGAGRKDLGVVKKSFIIFKCITTGK
jgi:hypothetical protein